jgi:hypothetical protein
MSMLRGRLSTAGVGGRNWKIVWGRVERWKRGASDVDFSICMVGKAVARRIGSHSSVVLLTLSQGVVHIVAYKIPTENRSSASTVRFFPVLTS